MAYEGIQHGNRVSGFSTSKIDAVVVDQILNSATLWARFNRAGKKFNKPTVKKSIKVTRTNLGQSFKGLETLNSSASDTTIQLEWAHNARTHPAVKIMLEHMANEGQGEDINLGDFIDQEAILELNQDMGSLIYGNGAGDDILGLGALVDDGTNSSTLGGQSRSTYSILNSTVTASGGTLTLAKMATLNDTVSDSGENQQTTVMVSDFGTWSLYEQLLQPTVRNQYTASGYPMLGLGDKAMGTKESLGGRAGFTALTYRGIPYIRDKAATANTLFMLNENYLHFFGRTSVPSDFKGHISNVSLGKASTVDAAAAKPSANHGWFSQKELMMPNQAGLIRRYYCIGQMVNFAPRRQGKLTGITSV